jgi:hypothetical protein
MIYLIIIGVDAILVGGALIAIDLHVKKELKLRDKIQALKQKRIQKRMQMWHDADRLIESLKIESE